MQTEPLGYRFDRMKVIYRSTRCRKNLHRHYGSVPLNKDFDIHLCISNLAAREIQMPHARKRPPATNLVSSLKQVILNSGISSNAIQRAPRRTNRFSGTRLIGFVFQVYRIRFGIIAQQEAKFLPRKIAVKVFWEIFVNCLISGNRIRHISLPLKAFALKISDVDFLLFGQQRE